MQNINDSKTNRILAIYDRFRRGHILNKQKIADEFGVTARTIQRDFDEIRNYLADNFAGEEILYDHHHRGYVVKKPK